MKRKKLIAILTLVCFMFTLVPVAAMAEDATTLKADFEVTDEMLVTAPIIIDGDITISGGGTIKRAEGYTGALLSVPVGSSLVLESVTVDGNSAVAAEKAAIEVYGSLTLNSGATVKANNRVVETVEADWIMWDYQGTPADTSDDRPYVVGSGISVIGGSLTMEDGAAVTGNKLTVADKFDTRTTDGIGAGIGFFNADEFTMNGGEIRSNTVVTTGTARAIGGGIGAVSRNGSENGHFDVNIADGLVDSNTATTSTGGAYFSSDDTNNDSTRIEITGGKFSNNSSASSGGINIWSAVLDLSGDFVIENNEATTAAGGGLNIGTHSRMEMNGGKIQNNAAATNGGGINISNKTNITISDGYIGDNEAGSQGGGIYASSECVLNIIGDAEINNNKIESGVKTTAYGAGIYIGGYKSGSNVFTSELNISGGKITNNKLIITDGNNDSDSAKNLARVDGAAIYCPYVTFTMTGGTISGNEAIVTSTSGSANVYGAAVMVRYGEFIFTGGSITGNKAELNGVSAGGYGMVGVMSNATIEMGKNAVISENAVTAAVNGGAANLNGVSGLYVSDIETETDIRGIIKDNTITVTNKATDKTIAYIYGTGAYFLGTVDGKVSLEGEVTGNTVKTAGTGISAAKGGVYVNTVPMDLTGTVSGNKLLDESQTNANGTSSSYGGGIYVQNVDLNVMEGAVVSNNEAKSTNGAAAGGGIAINDIASRVTMTGGEISDNVVSAAEGKSFHGGGIYLYHAADTNDIITITGGKITGNTAKTGAGLYLGTGKNTTNNTAPSTSMLTLSGNPNISGNKKADGTDNNIYIVANTHIKLNSPLVSGATIGVTTATAPKANASVQITTVETDTTYYTNAVKYFVADAKPTNGTYVAQANTEAGYVELALTEDVYYKVTLDLENLTTTGSAVTLVKSGESYETELVADTGYSLPDTITGLPDGVAYDNGILSMESVTADTTITVDGVPNTYTVVFDGNGATSGFMSSQNMAYGTETALKENEFVKADYQFIGWNDGINTYADKQSVKNLTTENGATVTLSAVWKQKAERPEPILIQKVVEYTGEAQTFELDGYSIVEYQQKGQSVTPINVGTYDVVIAHDETEQYASYQHTFMAGLVIEKADSVVTPNSTAVTGTYGDTVNLSVTVAQASKAKTELNTVDFYYGTTLLGTAKVENGTAKLAYETTRKSIPVSADGVSVKAVYGGSDNWNGAEIDSITVKIDAKELTVIGLTAVGKTYDGDTSAVLSGGELNGVIGTDDVTAVMPTVGTVADANVGDNKVVTFAEITLRGDNASYYTLRQPSVTMNITFATPTITLEDKTAIYTGNPIALDNAVVALVPGETYSGGVVYTYAADDAFSDATTTAPTAVGTYYVKASVEAFGNYNGATSDAATLVIAENVLAAEGVVDETGAVKVTISGKYAGNDTVVDGEELNTSSGAIVVNTTEAGDGAAIATKVEVALPQNVASDLAEHSTALTIVASIGEYEEDVAAVTLDKDALDKVATSGSADKNAMISIRPAVVENAAAAVTITVEVEGNAVLPVGETNGTITIELPYAGSTQPYVYFVENGKIKERVASDWDKDAEKVVAYAKHLSTYAVYETAQQIESDSVTSTGGSSGFTGKYNYPISVEDVDNAVVKLSESNAVAGETVTITTSADAGYGVYEVIVTDEDGKVIPVTDHNDGTYSFTMPEGKASVQVVCKSAITMVIDSVYINVFGKTIKNDVAPKIVDNRTVLPIRVVAENLGADVDWDPATQKVTITKGDTVIELFIGKYIAYVNGEAVELDVAPFIENNRTYLPVRFVSEYLGAIVNWDADTRTVTIIKS